MANMRRDPLDDAVIFGINHTTQNGDAFSGVHHVSRVQGKLELTHHIDSLVPVFGGEVFHLAKTDTVFTNVR